jgi:hypothetical protein
MGSAERVTWRVGWHHPAGWVKSPAVGLEEATYESCDFVEDERFFDKCMSVRAPCLGRGFVSGADDNNGKLRIESCNEFVPVAGREVDVGNHEIESAGGEVFLRALLRFGHADAVAGPFKRLCQGPADEALIFDDEDVPSCAAVAGMDIENGEHDGQPSAIPVPEEWEGR